MAARLIGPFISKPEGGRGREKEGGVGREKKKEVESRGKEKEDGGGGKKRKGGRRGWTLTCLMQPQFLFS